MTTVCYKRVGRLQIMADVYPSEGRLLPLVVFIHGGALIWGSRKYLQPGILGLLNRNGYTVVSIDYRLAPFTKLAEILEDVADAILWAKSGCGGAASVDPSRIALFGSSAGAYLSLSAGSFAQRPAAVVSFYGYGSIMEAWYLNPSPHYLQQGTLSEAEATAALGLSQAISEAESERFPFYVYTRQKGIWPQTVTGMEIGELSQYCPVERVDALYPPTLLVHGTEDTDVPFESSMQMAKALAAAGRHAELHPVYNRNHAFDKNEDDLEVAVAYNKVLSFLSEHM